MRRPYAVLAIDEPALLKKGAVSLTLSPGEVPAPVALCRLLPEAWTSSRASLDRGIGAYLDAALAPRILDMVARLPLKTRPTADGLLPVRDLDQVRAFPSGIGPTVLFDLPWIPLYLSICLLFHP